MEPTGSGGASVSLPLVAVKATDSAVAVRGQEQKKTRDNKSVLDEESYIESVQKIIQRDFFPDVEKLRAQNEYLDAEECGDLEKMRQIAIKFGSSLGRISRDSPAP